MPYGYNRGGGYGGRPSGSSNPRKFLVGSYSSLATANTGNIAINVPVDAAQGKGIQVWSWEIEVSSMAWAVADNLTLEIVLAKTAGTAARYVNDPDVIAKISLRSEIVGAVVSMSLFEQTFDKDFYPAVPCITPQLHVTITNNSGATLSFYTKIWYTDFYVSYPQAVGLLQSQII